MSAAPSTCAVCDRPTHPGPVPACALHLIQWQGSPERDASPAGQRLRAAARGLLEGQAPSAAVHLQRVLAEVEQEADAEAWSAFVARARAELEGRSARAAKDAEEGEARRLEAEVQAEVVKELQRLRKRRRLFFWRANSGGAWLGEQFVRSNRTGTPDLVCSVRVERTRSSGAPVIFGVFLGLECKRSGGKQSEAQRKFELELREQGGGFYALVSSAVDAVRAVERVALLEAP